MADLPTRTAYARVESELGAEVFLGIYKKPWNLHGNLRVLPPLPTPSRKGLIKYYLHQPYTAYLFIDSLGMIIFHGNLHETTSVSQQDEVHFLFGRS